MRLPTVGDLFERKYQVREALGRGGFATVFRATDVEIGRDVALKILAPLEGDYPSTVVARFMTEARVIAGLQDPHTIRLFEFGQSESGLLYMVFQYVDGRDLSAVIAENGPLEAEAAVHVTRQLLGALAEAHASGVLHRDIKPANILIHEYMGDAYAAKLLDFGVAKVGVGAPGAAGLTRTGVLLGTPRYMAPEQVFAEPVTPASDIYSLGLVVYEMLVGAPAIVGRSQKELLKQQVSTAPLRVPEVVAWPALREVVERMMAREPRGRFQSVLEVAGALDAAIAQPNARPAEVLRPPEAQPPSVPQTLGPPSTPEPQTQSRPPLQPAIRRPQRPDAVGRRWVLWAAGGFAAIALAVVVLMSGTPRPPPARPRQPVQLPSALLKSAPAPSPAVPEVAPDLGPPSSVDAGSPDVSKPKVPRPDGCGKPFEHQHLVIDVVVSGVRRQVRMFVPSGYDPNHRYPVVLAARHKNDDAEYYARHVGLIRLQHPNKFVILAPEAPDRFDPWVEPEDIALFEEAVPAAGELLCLDRTHVYAIGHEAGGRLVRELACAMPLSAIATSGDGERTGDKTCVPDPPVPMLRMLGKDDFFVPVVGGRGCAGGDYLSVEQHDELWKQRNGCDGAPKSWSTKGPGECKTWTCEAAPYVSCLLEGGHNITDWSWKYLEPPGCAADPLGERVAVTAWDFFRREGRAIEGMP